MRHGRVVTAVMLWLAMMPVAIAAQLDGALDAIVTGEQYLNVSVVPLYQNAVRFGAGHSGPPTAFKTAVPSGPGALSAAPSTGLSFASSARRRPNPEAVSPPPFDGYLGPVNQDH